LTTHCSPAVEKPRSARIDASATLTIVTSSTPMNCARQHRTRTKVRLRLNMTPCSTATRKSASGAWSDLAGMPSYGRGAAS
jgi:hypothetical protein